jgi:hypothetical protein
MEGAVLIAITSAHFGHGAHTTDHGDVMTDGATGAVERGAEAVFGGFDFREVVQAGEEEFELRGREAWEGITGEGGADEGLGVEEEGKDRNGCQSAA